MKNHTRNIFTAALLSGVFSLGADAQVSYLGRIEWQAEPVEIVTESSGKGGSRAAELRLRLDWKELPEVSAQHSAEILPVLESADGSQSWSFSPIYVDGRTRAKAVDRMSVLSGIERPEGSIVLRPGKKDESGTIDYCARVPYSPDMLDGRIVLYETVTGCAGCLEGRDTLEFGKALPRYIPDWAVSASPAGGPKQRELRQRADLKFIVNLHDIRPDYADNAAVLDKVMNSIRIASDTSIFTVRAVRFIGYASPDGPEAFNRRLAGNRAASLADYVMKADETIPDSLFTVESVGEDWEGLFAAVDADPQISGNALLAEVRANLTEDNWHDSEWRIKSDSGLYDYMRDNILPPLRRTEYAIDYDIRNFTAEEAAELWEEHPEWLSVDEFKAAAQLHGKNSPEYLEILTAAVEAYPDDCAALNNAATALLEAGRADEAAALLEDADDPLLMNTLGVILASDGEYERAAGLFRDSAGAGSEEAAHNLEELEKVMFQL